MRRFRPMRWRRSGSPRRKRRCSWGLKINGARGRSGRRDPRQKSPDLTKAQNRSKPRQPRSYRATLEPEKDTPDKTSSIFTLSVKNSESLTSTSWRSMASPPQLQSSSCPVPSKHAPCAAIIAWRGVSFPHRFLSHLPAALSASGCGHCAAAR